MSSCRPLSLIRCASVPHFATGRAGEGCPFRGRMRQGMSRNLQPPRATPQCASWLQAATRKHAVFHWWAYWNATCVQHRLGCSTLPAKPLVTAHRRADLLGSSYLRVVAQLFVGRQYEQAGIGHRRPVLGPRSGAPPKPSAHTLGMGRRTSQSCHLTAWRGLLLLLEAPGLRQQAAVGAVYGALRLVRAGGSSWAMGR